MTEMMNDTKQPRWLTQAEMIREDAESRLATGRSKYLDFRHLPISHQQRLKEKDVTGIYHESLY